MKKYQFDKLIEPAPGCGFASYWDWRIREYGRSLVRAAVQEHSDDLPKDPWWCDNEPDTLPD